MCKPAECITYSDQLEEQLKEFSENQRKAIYNNLYAIELTDGCSNMCDFCGLNSKYGVRSVIPYSTLEFIADEITEITDRTTSPENGCGIAFEPRLLTLYDATDPLDYEYEEHTYFDVFKLFSEKGFKIITSTAIPAGKEELAIANLESIRQISISHMNRERLEPYFERLGISVYLDLLNYYIFKGHSRFCANPTEKIGARVDGTIEETINKLSEQDNSLPREVRFYDLRIDGNRPRYEVQTGKNLFLFCADKNLGEGSIYRKISDRDYTSVQNVGRAFHLESYRRSPFALGANGVKITPNGVFNVFCTIPSEGNTAGKIIEKITPEKFRVIGLEEAPYLNKYDKMERHYII